MKQTPLGTMPIETFLAEYWQKKPLFIRNGLPDIRSPLAGDYLAGLACEEGIEARLVIQHDAGAEWELKHGPFSEDIFATLPKSHWTLLVQAVDHWVPEAASLLEAFNFIPRWRIDDLMMSYASDGGGVGPHYDNYDVFLVQTSGSRLWQIGDYCDGNTQLRENLPVRILKQFNVSDSWVLQPGDILYLPPGLSHNGIAQGDGCITCSVGFRAPSHDEILTEYTDYLSEKLSDSMRYTDPDLHGQENPGEISRYALAKIRNIIHQHVEDETSISDWFGRYITTPKYQQPVYSEPEETGTTYKAEDLKAHLSAGGLVMRNQGSRFAFEAREANHILFVDGMCFDGLKDANELIKTLCTEIELSQDNLAQSDSNMALLVTLLNFGVLYLEEL